MYKSSENQLLLRTFNYKTQNRSYEERKENTEEIQMWKWCKNRAEQQMEGGITNIKDVCKCHNGIYHFISIFFSLKGVSLHQG